MAKARPNIFFFYQRDTNERGYFEKKKMVMRGWRVYHLFLVGCGGEWRGNGHINIFMCVAVLS